VLSLEINLIFAPQATKNIMKNTFNALTFIILTSFLHTSCGVVSTKKGSTELPSNISNMDSITYPGEIHFSKLKQLTDGGDNAEAYWSFDNTRLVFQANAEKWDTKCDQIFFFNPDKDFIMNDIRPKLLSTGAGRTTCAYFMPGDSTILYASTHHQDKNCPAEPERHGGSYVWAIYDSFDIFEADLNGNILRQLTDSPGYDAEATVSPDGQWIVFTSTRSGDLELYLMRPDGSDVRQVTNELGYDGGAFFSPDSKQLVFRASRPKTAEAKAEYLDLLSKGLVKPTDMEIFVCDIDGSNMKQVTNLGKANWAPYFHPSGQKIVFASNHATEKGFPFNLFMINVDGTGLKQISFDNTFDAFPMFSHDGKKLVFSSNRNNRGTRETNLFVTDWVE
jgi:TolB protein